MGLSMNAVERYRAALRGETVDRLPMIEWAGYMTETLERWRGEGLPPETEDENVARTWLGLDDSRRAGLSWIGPEAPKPTHFGSGILKDADDYERVRPLLYPRPGFDREDLAELAERHARGELIIWFVLQGFFSGPRKLLGIERHLLAFYDQPDLMRRINQDLVDFYLDCIPGFCDFLQPDMVSIMEDFSYKNGPMLSGKLFDEFLAPYYRQIVPLLQERGLKVFIDSDGDVNETIPWVREAGVDGMLPFERQCGCDPVAVRGAHPGLLMVGGFNKNVLKEGEAGIRREFGALLPAMRAGGYLPTMDHRVPPDCSLENYSLYLDIYREYAEAAVK